MRDTVVGRNLMFTIKVDKIDFVLVDPSLGASAQVDNFKDAINQRFHIAPENIEFTYVC